jgi:hypothetical protein
LWVCGGKKEVQNAMKKCKLNATRSCRVTFDSAGPCPGSCHRRLDAVKLKEGNDTARQG